MLFLVNDQVIRDIKIQKKDQREWIRKHLPWYKRYFAPSFMLRI
jgi:hypothetical protein